MARSLGQLEMQFFAYIQRNGLATVQSGDLVRSLGLKPIQERKLLSRLAQRDLIARVRRGLYLVPPRLPLGGMWSPGEFLALKTLVEDREGEYQITGPTAFNHYGWDDQIANRIYAYNDKISGDRQIGTVQLTLIRIKRERLGAVDNLFLPNGIAVIIPSKSRALMDAIYEWARFNTLPRAYDWTRDEIRRDDTLAAELVNICLKYGNQGTLRRIGRLLDTLGIPETLLRKVEKGLHKSSSVIPWIPTLPKRGKVDRRWGIVFNEKK